MSHVGKISVADSMCGLKRLIENSEDKFVTLLVNADARPIRTVGSELQATEGNLAHAHLYVLSSEGKRRLPSEKIEFFGIN